MKGLLAQHLPSLNRNDLDVTVLWEVEMRIIEALNNNIKHDIWGNYQMARQLGLSTSCGYLARKSLALARAVLCHRLITVNNRPFFDTWS